MASEFPVYVAEGAEHSMVQDFNPGAAANEPFIPGDFVFYDTADNEMKRCGVNPVLIAGLSEVDSALSSLTNKIQPNDKVPARILQGNKVLLALSSATTPTEAHVGDSYGITRNANGRWLLDVAKTTTSSRVKVVRVDIPNGIFYCVVHSNLLQFADVEVATA